MNSLVFLLLFCFFGLACAKFGRFFDFYQDYYQRNKQPVPGPPVDFSILNPSDCICRMKVSSRIVKGQIAAPNSVPWIISLAISGHHVCGGSIVNKKFILTVAHCVQGESASDLEVSVGLHHLSDANQNNTYAVKNIHMYPGFSSLDQPGDYALLELATPIEFVPAKVEPACINNIKQRYNGDLIIFGWGATTPGIHDLRTNKLELGESSPILKMAYVYEYRNKMGCNSFLICINSRDGSSSCQGDSGAPIHIVRNGRATVEGVSSFGDGIRMRNGNINTCTGKGAYSANHYYKDWFENIIGPNYCKP